MLRREFCKRNFSRNKFGGGMVVLLIVLVRSLTYEKRENRKIKILLSSHFLNTDFHEIELA